MMIKFHRPRKPGTVLVALVEVEEGIAPMALVAERFPSLTTLRVMAPSGAQRTIARAEAVLEDLPRSAWSRAVEVASARAVVAFDEGLLGGSAGVELVGMLRRAGAPVPNAEALEARRERRRRAAAEAEAALGFRVV